MEFDDPKIPEFASWSSYARFAQEVRQSQRFVWSSEIQAFLDTVLATIRDRSASIAKDTIYFALNGGSNVPQFWMKTGTKLEWI